MNTTHFVYPIGGGTPPFFLTDDGQVWPTGGGQPAYTVDDGTWYEFPTGQPAFFLRDGYLYTMAGEPTYYLMAV